MCQPSRKVRVRVEHTVEYTDPIEIASGERVSVGREDDEFPGWKWCNALTVAKAGSQPRCCQTKERKQSFYEITQRENLRRTLARKLLWKSIDHRYDTSADRGLNATPTNSSWTFT